MLFGCGSNEISLSIEDDKEALNQVLLLQVDYITKEFEGGKKFRFTKKTNEFAIANEYIAHNDFGSVKLIYKELNEPIFE